MKSVAVALLTTLFFAVFAAGFVTDMELSLDWFDRLLLIFTLAFAILGTIKGNRTNG